MARQSKFRDDGTTTDIPTALGENPQLEKQLDLLQYGKDIENLARWKEEPARSDRERGGTLNDYEARRKEKADRYQELAEKNRTAANQTLTRARDMAEVIPFGQPILVGHHSEGRDRRYRARINNTFNKASELKEKADYYERKAENATSNHTISSDDPEAVAKLKEKIAKAEESGAKKRLAQLERHSTDTTTEREAGNIRIVDNVEDNRLQMFFPDKPSEDIRRLLKSRGFRWSPTSGAWQRHRSNGANYEAEYIIEQINKGELS